MILSDLAKYSVTRSAARSFCGSWASCANNKKQSYKQTNKSTNTGNQKVTVKWKAELKKLCYMFCVY